MKDAFEALARGDFRDGLDKLRQDPMWKDDDNSLTGPFFLGFPGVSGWGEALFLASLLKRYAIGCPEPIPVFAKEDACSILRGDSCFDATAVQCYGQARRRGARSPLAILDHALTGRLLDSQFSSVRVDQAVAGKRQCQSKRIGVAWASGKESPTWAKSVPMCAFQELFAGRDEAIISFQRSIGGAHPRDVAPPGWEITDPDCLDCSDQTSVLQHMQNTDCMVTVSTTTAHIAACLNIRSVLLVADRPHQQWYWQAQGKHGKCFYPSVKVVIGGTDKQWWQSCLNPAREMVVEMVARPSVA